MDQNLTDKPSKKAESEILLPPYIKCHTFQAASEIKSEEPLRVVKYKGIDCKEKPVKGRYKSKKAAN